VRSGGVFQGERPLDGLKAYLPHEELWSWTSHALPPNGDGIPAPGVRNGKELTAVALEIGA
jgi:hypothetical protein